MHLASRKPSATDDRWAILADEVAMAANLFARLHESAPDAVMLIAGSAAQYGPGSPEPLPESAPLAPRSAYGSIKSVLERACTDATLHGGARVIWARTFNTLGPGQQADTPAADWARQVAAAERAEGGVVRTGDLGVVRDFLDVRDVADAYLALLGSDVTGRRECRLRGAHVARASRRALRRARHRPGDARTRPGARAAPTIRRASSPTSGG